MGAKYTAKLNIDKLASSLTARFSWTTEYAAAMHFGVTLKNGTEIPGRPWITEALKEVDVVAVYAAAYRRTLDADEALKETALVLNAKFTELISSNRWSYPRATKRSSGEVAGTMRNIVDLGGLRASQQLTFER